MHLLQLVLAEVSSFNKSNKIPVDVKADGVSLTLRIRLCIDLDSRRTATVDADVTRTSGDT